MFFCVLLWGGGVCAGAENISSGDTTISANKISEGFYQGIDTDSSSYYITKKDGLIYFRNWVNGLKENTDYTTYPFKDKTVYLLADINFEDSEDWIPIGYCGDESAVNNNIIGGKGKKTFAGTFDGNNHTVSNLHFEDTLGNEYAVGFFGCIKSGSTNIKNLKIKDVKFISTGSASKFSKGCVGAVVGSIYNQNVAIESCHVSGKIQLSGNSSVGGIAGLAWRTENCTVIGDTGSTISGLWAGGLLGYGAYPSAATMSGSSGGNTVSGVTITASYRAGSVVGEAKNALTLSNVTVGDSTVVKLNGEIVTQDVGNSVASVDGAYYGSLDDAMQAAYSGDKILDILADITLEKFDQNTTKYGYNVPSKNMTINGNGHTFKVTQQLYSNGNGDQILSNAENLTVKDWIIDLSGILTSSINTNDAAAFSVKSGSFENVTFKGGRYGLVVSNTTETVYLKNCVFDNVNNGNAAGSFYTEAATKLDVQGCTFNNSALSVNGTWNFINNTVSTDHFDFGNHTGTFSSNDLSHAEFGIWANVDLSGNYWGEEGLSQQFDSRITIKNYYADKDCTDKRNIFASILYPADKATTVKYFASFDKAITEAAGTNTIVLVNDMDTYTVDRAVTFKVNKGSYKLDVKAAEGYVLTVTESDGITTYTTETASARIGSTYYTTLQEAIDALTEGSTLYYVSGDTHYAMSYSMAKSLKFTSDGKILAADASSSEDLTAANALNRSGMLYTSAEAANTFNLNITDDINMDGQDWIPFDGKNIRVNGNGHTISNLTTEGTQAGFISYADGCYVYDLTLENVTACGNQAGAFFGQSVGGYLSNCKLSGTVNISFKACSDTQTSNAIGAIAGWVGDNKLELNGVTITDGTVITLDATGMYEATSEAARSSWGNHPLYTGTGKADGVTLGEGAALVIIGGTFDNDPSGYVAAGYAAVKDGSVYVIKKAVIVRANDQKITYGSSIATGVGNCTVTGLFAGSELASITLTASTTNVTANGSITPSNAKILSGDTDITDDYAITYENGLLVIADIAPELSAQTEITLRKGQSQELTLTDTAGTGTRKWSVDPEAPDWVSLDQVSDAQAVLTVKPDIGVASGTYTVTASVTNEGDPTLTASAAITITVTAAGITSGDELVDSGTVAGTPSIVADTVTAQGQSVTTARTSFSSGTAIILAAEIAITTESSDLAGVVGEEFMTLVSVDVSIDARDPDFGTYAYSLDIALPNGLKVSGDLAGTHSMNTNFQHVFTITGTPETSGDFNVNIAPVITVSGGSISLVASMSKDISLKFTEPVIVIDVPDENTSSDDNSSGGSTDTSEDTGVITLAESEGTGGVTLGVNTSALGDNSGGMTLEEVVTLLGASAETLKTAEEITITGGITSLAGIEQLTNLVTLDLTQAEDLAEVVLTNASTVQEVKLTGNQNVTNINITGSNVTTLNATGCSGLKELKANATDLANIDLTNCSQLQNIDVSETKLTELDLTDCVNLEELNCDEAAIQEITLPESNANLVSVSCRNNNLLWLDLRYDKYPNLMEFRGSGQTRNDVSISTTLNFWRFLWDIWQQAIAEKNSYYTPEEYSEASKDYAPFNVDNISDVEYIDSEDIVGQAELERGTVRLPQGTRSFGYNYDTGFRPRTRPISVGAADEVDGMMDVTLNVASVENSDDYLTPGNSRGGCNSISGLGAAALLLLFMKFTRKHA